jgi:hypothetical protein
VRQNLRCLSMTTDAISIAKPKSTDLAVGDCHVEWLSYSLSVQSPDVCRDRSVDASTQRFVQFEVVSA